MGMDRTEESWFLFCSWGQELRNKRAAAQASAFSPQRPASWRRYARQAQPCPGAL